MRSAPDPRVLSAAVTAAVTAAAAADPEAFGEASAALAKLDAERVGIVQSAAIRSLLEQAYPDGLDADDARATLTRVTLASAWLAEFDVDLLLVVLGGALGLIDPDEPTPRALDRAELARHATLVIADLAAVAKASVSEHVRQSVAEIERAETMEMP